MNVSIKQQIGQLLEYTNCLNMKALMYSCDECCHQASPQGILCINNLYIKVWNKIKKICPN